MKRKTTQEMCPDVQLESVMSMHHNKAHKRLRSLAFCGLLVAISACFVACLNMSSTLSLYLAEHSKYSTALIFLLASSPCQNREFYSHKLIVNKMHDSSFSSIQWSYTIILIYIRPEKCVELATWINVTVFWPDDQIFLVRTLSSRRSALHPTRMMGTPPQKCCTSGFH